MFLGKIYLTQIPLDSKGGIDYSVIRSQDIYDYLAAKYAKESELVGMPLIKKKILRSGYFYAQLNIHALKRFKKYV